MLDDRELFGESTGSGNPIKDWANHTCNFHVAEVHIDFASRCPANCLCAFVVGVNVMIIALLPHHVCYGFEGAFDSDCKYLSETAHLILLCFVCLSTSEHIITLSVRLQQGETPLKHPAL